MLFLYGIPNCSTVKKARARLDSAGTAYEFVDVKKHTPDAATLRHWHEVFGDALVNRRGTTWRQLSDAQKAAADTPEGAVALILEKPSVMKRPVLVSGSRLLLGYDDAAWTEAGL